MKTEHIDNSSTQFTGLNT